jgi:molybdenum cofactor guanylyltransferase
MGIAVNDRARAGPRATIAAMATTAGIVLAGGRSSRMGSAKAALEWHGSTLLRRVVGLVERVVDRVVVVRAPGQELPALPAAVALVEDAREDAGPLEGIRAGLAALRGTAEAVYVSSTDVPLLHPRFVARVLAGLGEADAAVPLVEGVRHPLTAAYRASLAPQLEALVAAGQLRAGGLLERCRVAWLDRPALLADPALAAVDPELESLRNLNAPADYAAARALPPPRVRVSGDGARPSGTWTVTVRAATVGAALAALELERTRASLILDGRVVGRDPELPLAARDELVLSARSRHAR